MMTPNNLASHLRKIRGCLVGASVLLAWDAAGTGSFLLSVLVCTVWIIVSLVKAVIQRPGRGLGLFRIAVPVLTLAIVGGQCRPEVNDRHSQCRAHYRGM